MDDTRKKYLVKKESVDSEDSQIEPSTVKYKTAPHGDRLVNYSVTCTECKMSLKSL